MGASSVAGSCAAAGHQPSGGRSRPIRGSSARSRCGSRPRLQSEPDRAEHRERPRTPKARSRSGGPGKRRLRAVNPTSGPASLLYPRRGAVAKEPERHRLLRGNRPDHRGSEVGSRPLPRPRPVERTSESTRSPDSSSCSGSQVNVSHASWTSTKNRRIPSWPSSRSGFGSRSDMSRRKSGSHSAASASTSPLFNASCARRTISTLSDISPAGVSRSPRGVQLLRRREGCAPRLVQAHPEAGDKVAEPQATGTIAYASPPSHGRR